MAKVFLLHWNRMEAEDRAASLRQAGHTVSLHWSTEEGPNLKESLPDVAVISLDRLPSHGRAVAEWLWEAKRRQHIPIVFAGGEPDKVRATRAKFPRALYCSTSEILSRIMEALSRRRSTARPRGERPGQVKANSTKRPNKALQRSTRGAKGAKSRGQSRAARG